ncbi:hypothetical protein [Streptomyces sp. NPDC049040]|uniref:hypothetical protein n=1 Tax=Streptomyces sp. NPDC049040 TaxID=3365593 RepID=UPI003712DEFE
MRSPDELDRVDWHALTHAYGPADNVPGNIRALYWGGEEAAEEAMGELWSTIRHQNPAFTASAPAVPFLVHALVHVGARRADLLMLLATLADHYPEDVHSPYWTGSPVEATCAEVCRELPQLLPCLRDPERGVRRAAMRVVAAVADLLPAPRREALAAEADALYAGDPVPAVRADAMVLRVRLGGASAPLDSPLPEVRLAAAMVAAERSGPPYPPEVIEVLATEGADRGQEDEDFDADFDAEDFDVEDDDFPWPGGAGGGQGEVTDLLLQDPDAALSVAARWIAEGDLGAHGSWLAEEVANKWRDREPAVIDLMLASLPHQDGEGALANRLDGIGRWIALHPQPGTGLRDTLYGYALRATSLSARPALLALVRARDPRALDLLRDNPYPSTLRAASAHFPGAADRLLPVIRRELAKEPDGSEVVALIEALGGLGTEAIRAAAPELVACLRSGSGAITASRHIGLAGLRTPEIESLLLSGMGHRDAKTRAAAALARYRLTGDAGPTLDVFAALLSSPGEAPWHLSALEALGPAAARLLPLVEPLLTESYEPTRVGAAEACYWLTGSPDRSVPLLTAAVDATPLGLRALKSLAAIAPVSPLLHPALQEFATSPHRLIGPELFEEVHPDEQLRTLAHRLLALG